MADREGMRNMSEQFFNDPILNSPYEYPNRHWELDQRGQPTQKIVHHRRLAKFITPIPAPKKQKKAPKQDQIFQVESISTEQQKYDPSSLVNQVRNLVDVWRKESNPAKWNVTPETARLLQHWRHHQFAGIRPFFCQLEAVETLIWLMEVAPNFSAGKKVIEKIKDANDFANPGLVRAALKLATGAGKTTVMAMIIAWQTVNAVRRPQSKKFTRGFLVVAPGITIRDRLRVLLPNDVDSYYSNRELVPPDMMEDIHRAKIVITNYHAFKLREKLELSKGTRALLEGKNGEINTLETEGQMIQRVIPDLMAMKNILVLNDEAHHCYREKPISDEDEEKLTGDERKEAEENNEAARLWISGLEIIARNLGLLQVVDLSATPFFLSGSGYVEGTLFPWTLSDFSLMDAIECGIVKLPRVPVADNIAGNEMPMYRDLWSHIGKKMPKKGKGSAGSLDPLSLPPQLQTALEALYGHYEKTFQKWEESGAKISPCFIVVCNNTSTSKLVYDYISGFHREQPDGTKVFQDGRLTLFRNYNKHGDPLPRPNTLLIDSRQLESGDALDPSFRTIAAEEIEIFKREIIERTGDSKQAADIDEQSLLREVMNTVGRPGKLGASIRCVVSVSMLTEGWDANTVTHVLGVRAFGTQLLCEQVIGRALRRQSYELNENNRFSVEYADILGIPFDFTAEPVISQPQPPRETVQVKAVRPDRDHLEIQFPRVAGYRVDIPNETLTAQFDENSTLELTPDLIGATQTRNEGIIGESADLNLVHTGQVRPSQVLYELTSHLLFTKWRDENGEAKLYLFGQLKRIARQWLDNYLVCKGGTYPAQLKYKTIADLACEKITAAITRSLSGKSPITAVLDPYNPMGSTMNVNFATTKKDLWQTDARFSHVNYVVLDSDWEGEFCRVVESHPKVRAYVKNHSLGFEVPYNFGSESRIYRPDFIVLVDDGNGDDDLLRLVVEIKGYRKEDAKVKRGTMETYWVPGVNHLGRFGRWAFAEYTNMYTIESEFKTSLEENVRKMIENAGKSEMQKKEE
jgi:type III restriction enzyme